jgi:hypothetical protein
VALNRCAGDGFLVGPQFEIPQDPTDYCWGGRDPVVGCNHLRCSVCGCYVKNKAGYIIKGELAKFGTAEWRARVDALYDGDDWDRLPFLQREPTFRLYVCRCGPVAESFQRDLESSTVDGISDSGNRIPWSCDGHPVATPPLILDGVAIDGEDALPAIVRSALGGFRPPSVSMSSEMKWTWASRLRDRLAGGTAAQIVQRTAREGLSDDDPDVRAGAISFFDFDPDVEAHRRIWDLARGDRVGFAGVRDRAGRDLELLLVGSVAKSWSYEQLEQARELVLREATTPGHGAAVIPAIAQRDIQWLLAHVEGVVRANPDCAALVIQKLFEALAYTGFAIEDVARRVVAVPGVSREQLRQEISTKLFGDARKRVLDAIGEAPLH